MQIQNPDVGQILRDEAKLTLAEVSSLNVSPNVQPVLDVTPSHQALTIVRNTTNTSTGSVSVYTTPTDKDFFLSFLCVGATEDASCDNTMTYADLTIGGVVYRLIQMPKTTLTARTDCKLVVFNPPIKVDRNTAIRANNSFTVGTARKSIEIAGYLL